MNMREEITRWMSEHAIEYTSAIFLAQGAIETFSIDDERSDVEFGEYSWVWDRAREVFDVYNAKRMEDRYA